MKKPMKAEPADLPPMQQCVVAHRTEDGNILDTEAAHAAEAAKTSNVTTNTNANAPAASEDARAGEGVISRE